MNPEPDDLHGEYDTPLTNLRDIDRAITEHHRTGADPDVRVIPDEEPEPHPTERPLIIHHGNCPDGFGAAWWLGRHIGPHDKHAATYESDPPEVTGRHVWIVDFCYPTDVLTAMARDARTITILDHHQTSVGWIDALPRSWDKPPTIDGFCDLMELGAGPFVACIDQTRSGVGLVSQYVRRWRGARAPAWLERIEDRDLWRFRLVSTPAVFAAVTSRPYTVEAWDAMFELGLDKLRAEGEAIERYRQQLIDSTVASAFEVNLLGRRVWCAASPYAIGSDVGAVLAERDPAGFAAYFVPGTDTVRFGLRSGPDGIDVAALASTVGGGGHKHAAGFGLPRPLAMAVLAAAVSA